MKKLIFIFTATVAALLSGCDGQTAKHTDISSQDSLQIFTDLVYSHKDGMALTMDLYIPKTQNGAGVIFINSGGFFSPFVERQCKGPGHDSLWQTNSDHWSFIPKKDLTPDFFQQFSFEELLKNGYTVFDVRHSSAPKYMLDEITTDVNSAITFVKGHADLYKISKDRLGVFGGSAGGYLAGYCSANPQNGNNLKATVLYYPAGYDWLNKMNARLRQLAPSLSISEPKLDSLSLKNYITDKMPPTLILYGELDSNYVSVPSDSIISKCKSLKVKCEKMFYKNTGHCWLNNGKYSSETGDKAMTDMIQWFNKNL